MKFRKLILQRQSVRRYSDRPVESAKISSLVESVRFAPSASNSQPWRLIIVDEPILKDQVARATFSDIISFNRFAVRAPVIAVLIIEKGKIISKIGGKIKSREFPLIDIGIAAEHFCLQAAELGLGTCMTGWFNEKKIKNLLHIPHGRRIGLLITLGYPEDDYPLRKKIRKAADEMCSFNSYK